MMTAATAPEQPELPDTGSLPAVLALCYRARRGALVIFLLVLGAAVGVAFAWPRTYRAQVVMVPVSDKGSGGIGGLLGQVGGVAALAGLNLSPGGSNRDESIAVLASREFARRFIEERALLPRLFSSKWDSATNSWKEANPARVPTVGDGVKKLVEDVRKVNVDEVSGLVTLTVDWRDRVEAAQWANEMVARANREMRERAVAEAQKSLDYLNAEADKASVQQLKDAIYRVVETQIKTIMLARVREDYAFRVIDPAVVPDANKYIWPKQLLVISLGVVAATLLGMIWIFGVYLSERFTEGYRQSVRLRR